MLIRALLRNVMCSLSEGRVYGALHRPVGLFHMMAGGCGGCALELHALRGAAYSLERYGVSFVSAPHLADFLLVSGVITRTMMPAIQSAWESMPQTKGLIAIGDCAVDGGIFSSGYAIWGGMEGLVRRDIDIPGCPPPPEIIMDALMGFLHSLQTEATHQGSLPEEPRHQDEV